MAAYVSSYPMARKKFFTQLNLTAIIVPQFLFSIFFLRDYMTQAYFVSTHRRESTTPQLNRKKKHK